jgi:hypothetical protein
MAAAPQSVSVGIFPTTGPLDRADDARTYLAAVRDAGIDHVCCGDHVSFFVARARTGFSKRRRSGCCTRPCRS